MQQLVTLSNDTLLQNTKNLVASERRIGTEIIHHLREILRRDLHLKLGYNSLFSYMVEELKYSEGSAHRRIATLKLLDSIPVAEAKKIEEKINSGVMSLTTVAMVQDFAAQKKKLMKSQDSTKLNPVGAEQTTIQEFSLNQKLDLLKSIEGLSKKATERVLIAAAPELAVPQEKERALTTELTEIRLVLNEKTIAKLKRIKELRSHVNANPSYSELIDDMADLILKKIDPKHKAQELTGSHSNSPGHDQTTFPAELAPVPNLNKNRNENGLIGHGGGSLVASPPHARRPDQMVSTKTRIPGKLMLLGSLNKLRSRHIPTKLRAQIWQRDHGQCSYNNPQTGKTCNSTYLLQVEHKIPFAKNGATSLENLTLLCANHNQMRAREEFNRKQASGLRSEGTFSKNVTL